jgi:hypothetical protein
MRKAGLWNAYRIPVLLAVLSVAGLVSALLEDGLFDVVSWALLGAIVLAMVPALWRWPDRRPATTRSERIVASEADGIRSEA